MPRESSPNNLKQLPLTWHVAMRRLNTWIVPEGGFATHPTILLVALATERIVLGHEVYFAPPEAEEIFGLLLRIMKKPERLARIKAHRPQQIYFELDELAQSLKQALKEIGVETGCQPADQEIDELISSIESMMIEKAEAESAKLPGILTMKENRPELVGSVWAAAADYYRAAPWKYLDDGQPLALEFSPILEAGSPEQNVEKKGFIQLLGYGGMEFGIVFYWKWDDVLNFYEMMKHDPKESIPAEGWNAFTFDDAATIPTADLEAIEKYGWEIASPEAYPLPLIYFGDRLERPGAEMLCYYEAALRSIPQFVNHLQSDDENDYQALEMQISVETACGPRMVTIRYPAGELPASIFLDDEEDFDEDSFESDDLIEDAEKHPDFYFEDEEDEENGEDFFLDKRAIERELAEISQMLEGIGGESDRLSPELNKAQQIMYRAWEERQPARRIKLARKALEASPDCADAYVLLAEEEAETPEEACGLYEKGMQAGMRALGEKYFTKEYEGMFWGLLETRGYMRARAGLAECLEYLDRSDEAIAHYEALLHLNPNDNQGVRYQLEGLLIRQNMNIQAGKLLEEYKEDASAIWAYSRALLAFRRLGPSVPADAALRRALRTNPYAPPYLIGTKPLPEELPDFMGFGDENEAIDYAAGHFGNWWGTPGAIPWLKEMISNTYSRKVSTGKSKKKHRR